MTDWNNVDDARRSLRSALLAAMKRRDTHATNALRSFLSAIDNAEAPCTADAVVVQPGVIAGAVAGLGAAEVPRRVLSVDEVDALLCAEIEARRASIIDFERAHRPDGAAAALAELAILEALQ